jgi:hypothetical protein
VSDFNRVINIDTFRVNQLPADLPKVDFAALKRQMPTHSGTLDALQKQYEALKIPYGEIPAALTAEIEKWNKYNVRFLDENIPNLLF